MARDDAYLVDILDAAKLALAYVSGKTKDEFDNDIQCQDAVIRRLEILGEAARRVTEQTRAKFPLLPWNAMMNMRNVLINEYDDVDLPIVWDTVRNDLPPLIAELKKIVPPEELA
jgi:uncharacterized protein with HEPN domain